MSGLAELGSDSRDDLLVWIDHREEEDAIVRAISERLDAQDALEAEWRDDGLWVRYHGQQHRLPLTGSALDRYVVISSVAALIADRYAVFFDESSRGDDTHGLLVVSKTDLAFLDEQTRQVLARDFSPLELGLDYFGGIRIPYLGHDDHNPDCLAELQAQQRATEELVRNVMASPTMQQALTDTRREIAALQAGKASGGRWRALRRFALTALALFVVLRVVRCVAERW